MSKLGGWWRMWLVFSFFVMAWAIYQSFVTKDRSGFNAPPADCISATVVVRGQIGAPPPSVNAMASKSSGTSVVDTGETQTSIPVEEMDRLLKEGRATIEEPTSNTSNFKEIYENGRDASSGGGFIAPTADVQRASAEDNIKNLPRYRCSTWSELTANLMLYFLLSITVLIVGFAVRWIRAGFRKSREP